MCEMAMTFMTDYPRLKSCLYLNQWEFSQDFRKVISSLPSQKSGPDNTFKVLIIGTYFPHELGTSLLYTSPLKCFLVATLTIIKTVLKNQSVTQKSNKLIKMLEKVGILLYFVLRLSLVPQKRIYAILCVFCMARLYLNCIQLVTAIAASSRNVSHDEYLP